MRAVGRLGIGVMLFQRFAVVRPFVAEPRAETVGEGRILGQPQEQEMRDLVAHVADHRAVKLAEAFLPVGKHGIGGFGHVDGDLAVGMAHDDIRLTGGGLLGQHLEDRPRAGVLRREPAPAHEVGDHPALGMFAALPERQVVGFAQVGHRLRHGAGAAKRAVLCLPVAGDLFAVRAERRVGQHGLRVRVEGDGLATAAGGVVEEDVGPAVGAMENAHRGLSDCLAPLNARFRPRFHRRCTSFGPEVSVPAFCRWNGETGRKALAESL